jgi:AcrR family transcriptional regulator
MQPDSAPRTRLSPEIRRRLIITEALGVFARNGYAETDLAEVAEAAGVGRPLIYHYFPGGKEDLYVAVVEEAWSELLGRLVIEPSGAPGVMPVNLSTYLDLVEEGDPAVVIIRGSRLLESPRIRESTHAAGTAFARGMAVNQVGTADPPAPVLSALLGFLSFLETILEEWIVGALTREQVEALIAATIPAIVGVANDVAGRGRLRSVE